MKSEIKYEKMTKSDLLELAKEHNIKGRHSMKKEELIDALSAASDKPNPVMKKSGVKKIEKKTSKDEAVSVGYEIKTDKPKEKAPLPDYPIPVYYDKDTIFMFAVEPDGEYVYWEVSAATQEKLKKELNISECRFDLRLYTEDSQMAAQSVGARGDWYFRVWAPLKGLWAELGVWDKHGKYHRVLRSSVVIMPSNVVAESVDTKWMTVTDKWEKVYKLSGMEDDSFLNIGASDKQSILRRLKEHMSSSNLGGK